MHKIIAFVFFILYNLQSFSQNYSLVIFSNSGSTFDLNVNNIKINESPQSNIKVFNLQSGWQQIFIVTKSINDSKSLVLKDSILIKNYEKLVSKEFTYTLEEENGKLKLKYITLSEPSGPIKPLVPEKPIIKEPEIDNSIYGNLYKSNNNKPDFYSNYDEVTKSCKVALSDLDAQHGINLLSKCNDDERKLRYLEEIITKNCLSTFQLISFIELIPIEIDKLNCCKLAYPHLTDPQNYKAVLPSFKYQTVKDAYSNFIKEQEAIQKQKQLNCKEPINDSEFEKINSKIKSITYEIDKVKEAKKLLVNSCINTTQAKALLNLISHDREKLELLKNIVPVITDKENTKNLADELQYSESKTEFLKQTNEK